MKIEPMNEPTLTELQEDWHELIEHEGGICPVCQRFGKIYPRRINLKMARNLIWLHKACAVSEERGQWVDVPKIAPRNIISSNQHPTLKYWGLVERKPASNEKQKHSGIWRITALGIAFVEGKVSVPAKIYHYNDTLMGATAEQVFIHDCFKTHFDYQEVMTEPYKTR